MDNTTHQIVLEDWNYSIATKLIPDSVILMLYLVIGIIGNSIVIYVHIWRMKGNIDDRYFVPVLAVADLLACVTNTCFSLSINLHPVSYTNDIACKTMWFICINATSASSLVLLVIAVQRYLKICRPFGHQMTIGYKRFALALLVLVSLLISFPSYFFYGSRDVTHETGTLGKRCTNVRGPWTKTEPLVFKAAITLVIITVIVSLIVFYTLIGCVVRKRSKFRRNTMYKASASSNVTFTTDTEETCVDDKKSDNKQTNIPSIPPEIQLSNKPPKIPGRKSDQNRISGMRLSIIFMLISSIFILSYIPKAGMMIWESRQENFWTELSTSEMGIYRFLYTFFIINNIVNPFIYGFFDRRFRKEFYRMIPCLMHKL